jgi:hypothetical protein
MPLPMERVFSGEPDEMGIYEKALVQLPSRTASRLLYRVRRIHWSSCGLLRVSYRPTAVPCVGKIATAAYCPSCFENDRLGARLLLCFRFTGLCLFRRINAPIDILRHIALQHLVLLRRVGAHLRGDQVSPAFFRSIVISGSDLV